MISDNISQGLQGAKGVLAGATERVADFSGNTISDAVTEAGRVLHEFPDLQRMVQFLSSQKQ